MKNIVLILFFFVAFFNSNLYAQDNQNSKIATKQQKQVLIVYGSEDCHYCINTQKYLKENNIEFIFFDIDKNPDALKEMLVKLKTAGISTSNLGIPVIDKQGTMFTNNGVFEEFLKKLN